MSWFLFRSRPSHSPSTGTARHIPETLHFIDNTRETSSCFFWPFSCPIFPCCTMTHNCSAHTDAVQIWWFRPKFPCDCGSRNKFGAWSQSSVLSWHIYAGSRSCSTSFTKRWHLLEPERLILSLLDPRLFYSSWLHVPVKHIAMCRSEALPPLLLLSPWKALSMRDPPSSPRWRGAGHSHPSDENDGAV